MPVFGAPNSCRFGSNCCAPDTICQSGAVTVSTVEDGMAQDLVATPAMFEMAPTLPQLGKVSLPLSGFRLRSQINSKKVWDEFLVFQGASYFRAVAQNLLYGLSARGLAINTAEPSGEEFPAFTHFWIERPGPRARSIVIYALLESESTTGAYRFTVQPGVETVMDVQLTLFPRTDMHVGGHRAAHLHVLVRRNQPRPSR